MILYEDDKPSQNEWTSKLKGRNDQVPEDGSEEFALIRADYGPVKLVIFVTSPLIKTPVFFQARFLLSHIILWRDSTQLIYVYLVFLCSDQDRINPAEEQL